MKFIKTLHGGKRNIVKLFSTGSDFVVSKTFKREAKQFDFYNCEKATLLSLNDTGFTPKILDYNDNKKELILEFIRGNLLTRHHSNFHDIGINIGELHSLKLEDYTQGAFSFRRDPLCDMEDIIRIFAELGYTMDTETLHEYRSTFKGTNYDKKIHGSLIPSNIIIDKKGHTKFIDFEMASINNPFLDIAYLSSFIDPKSALNLLNGYIKCVGIRQDIAYRHLNYAKNHLCALSLCLFMMDSHDKEINQRAHMLIRYLSRTDLGMRIKSKNKTNEFYKNINVNNNRSII